MDLLRDWFRRGADRPADRSEAVTRICITGGPRTGKTTLAESMWPLDVLVPESMRVVRHTDRLIDLGWSEASAAAALWLSEPGPWIIEGVAVSRALRKWRDMHPGEPPPCDRVIYLSEPHEAWTPGQARMAMGVATVHDELTDWLRAWGIHTEYSPAHQPRASTSPG